jgi:hypothetical protein
VTANSTLITFYLNTTTANNTDAEDQCKHNGGHLAAFTSLAEQREVEQFYITSGYLFPKWVNLPLPALAALPATASHHAGVGSPCGQAAQAFPASLLVLHHWPLMPTNAQVPQVLLVWPVRAQGVPLLLLEGPHHPQAQLRHLSVLGQRRARQRRQPAVWGQQHQLHRSSGQRVGLGGRGLQQQADILVPHHA